MIGIRVWQHECRLVAKDRSGKWEPFGPARQLPVIVPRDPRGIAADPLLLTAFQYDMECPGSDLLAVLAQMKPLEQALSNDADAVANESAG